MPKISPIAEYLRINKAVAKRDRYGCHFISQDGLYLGFLRKQIINDYKVITLDVFGEGCKKMFHKSVAYGQQLAYIVNKSAPLGISLVPFKTYMRKINVDFINGTSKVVDTEKKFTNHLDLIAVDEKTQVGLFDTDKPFNYDTITTNDNVNNLKHNKFKPTIN